ITLRELIEQLTFSYLKSRHPVVVDTVALGEEGIRPGTPLTVTAVEDVGASPPSRAPGLEGVAARTRGLLTARRQLAPCTGGPPGRLSGAVEGALGQAARDGHDPSGRFRAAIEWLRPRPEPAGPAAEASPLAAESARGDWTAWEPVAGAADD